MEEEKQTEFLVVPGRETHLAEEPRKVFPGPWSPSWALEGGRPLTGEKAWHSRPRALHGPGVEGEAEGACRGQRVDLEREALLGRPPWCTAYVPGSALPPRKQGWSRNWRVTACGILPWPKIQLPSLRPPPRPPPLQGNFTLESSPPEK